MSPGILSEMLGHNFCLVMHRFIILYDFTLGNYMCLPIDTQKGIKVLKDKIYAFHSGWGDNSNATQKEFSNFRQYWIKRKKSRPIKYDYLGNILNNYVAVYVIPYDAYGSLTTDNIASCACLTRMYWKDP